MQIPEVLAMQRFHFLLPDLLGFQNSFEAAVKLLCGATVSRMPVQVASLIRSADTVS